MPHKGGWTRVHGELPWAHEAKTEWPGTGKAGAHVQPAADFRQITFTWISLFPHPENRGNTVCSPLTSHQCFL